MKQYFALVVGLAAFGVYLNALFNDFVMDDFHIILENPYIKSITYVPDIFFSNVLSYVDARSSLYRPVAHLIWMLSYHVFGLAPWGYHLVNVLFHTGVSLLVFVIARRLFQKTVDSSASDLPAFVVAVLFAVHPIHVEAVTWVAATMDGAYTFFYLLAFYLYLRSTEDEPPFRRTLYVSACSFFLAALCKEPALTFPFVLLTYDLTCRRETSGVAVLVKRQAPYLVALGAYLALRIAALGGFAPVRKETGLTAYQYLLNVMVLFAQYLEKLLFPVNLNNWHVFSPLDSLRTVRGATSVLIVLGFSILLMISQRRMKLGAFGLWLIVIPLLPALYIPGLTQGLENAFSERYLYLPSFGYVLFLGVSTAWVWSKRSSRETLALALTLVIVIGLYTVGTISRNRVWKDSRSLWSDALKKSPNNPEPYNVLGDVLRLENRVEEAIEYYKMGLRLRPDSPHIHANLGTSYARLGQVDQAIQYFEGAIRLKPRFAEAYNNLGVVYIHKGQMDAAIGQFQTALRLRPSLASAHHNLGLALSNLGDIDSAVEHYEAALRLDPDYADAHVNLGITLGEKGNLDMAIEHFQIAMKLNPDDAVTLQNLANAYRLKGMNDDAEEHLRRARAMRGPSR